MSALNVFVSPEKVSLLTDTSLYNGAGTIIGFACKAAVVESWTGAISGRGDVWGIVTAAALAEEFGSFDEFIARSGAILEHKHAAALADAQAAGATGQTRIEVTAIGWSESRDRAMAFMISNMSDDGPAFVWSDVCDGDDSGFSVGPEIDSAVEEWRMHRVGADTLDYKPADFDPIKHGMPLMEAQRRSLTDPELFAGEPFHAVGGSVWCSIVTRDGVEQRVIHEWGDEVGKPIVPAAVDDRALPRIAPSFVPKDRASQAQWFTARAKGLIDPVTLMPIRKLARAA